MTISNEIRALLTKTFAPDHIEITDDSHRHAGHAGAKQGGHFTVKIISGNFEGKSLSLRHKLVYTALGHLMKTKIHALALQTLTPEEFSRRKV